MQYVLINRSNIARKLITVAAKHSSDELIKHTPSTIGSPVQPVVRHLQEHSQHSMRCDVLGKEKTEHTYYMYTFDAQH